MSQNQAILNYLKEGNKLTAIDALHRFNCLRLSGRIKDIRNEGYDVKTDIITLKKSKKRIAQYSIIL